MALRCMGAPPCFLQFYKGEQFFLWFPVCFPWCHNPSRLGSTGSLFFFFWVFKDFTPLRNGVRGGKIQTGRVASSENVLSNIKVYEWTAKTVLRGHNRDTQLLAA